MNHSFNVEIATQYGIEKAILIENFYFWISKNKANKKNIYDGKPYTYNTAEAFEELFPYMKARKISQLLREMEQENLIISRQFGKYDRTKSYTLTDYALSLFVQSNIQKHDNGTNQNMTMDSQDKVCSLNTDINTDINPDVNTDIYKQATPAPSKKLDKPKFVKPKVEEIKEYADENNLTLDEDVFFDYYESKGWLVGRTPMKDWKATVRNWCRRRYDTMPQGEKKEDIQAKTVLKDRLRLGE